MHVYVYLYKMIYLIVVLVIVIGAFLYLQTNKPKNYPVGPKWYPVQGSATTLKKYIVKYGSQHIGLSKLANDFKTNVLGLKLGRDLVVVVFTYELVKHVLKSEDFECRPDNFFIRLRSMGTKKGITCADGELWNTQRNFVVKHLRNVGFGKEQMQNMIQAELIDILLFIKTEGPHIEVGTLLSPAVISVLWNLTTGVQITKNDTQLKKVLHLLSRRTKLFDMSGGILNMYPWLRFIIPERSGYKLMLELNEEMKQFFIEVIREHYVNWEEGKNDDVIYAFISEMKKNRTNSHFTEDQLIMVCADILIAGAQTTSNTLDFAFLAMILHKDIQRKVHKQLDEVYGCETVIEYSTKNRVPYIEAVLMEVERYYYVAPIIGPRRVIKNVALDGYVIPKNTTILISTYSVHMDKEFWKDPDVFRPERFIDECGRLVIPEKFIPFGLGRRRCLGEMLAKSCIFTFFVGIMRDYTISSLESKPSPTGKPISGITLKPESYAATFTKRV